MIALYKPVENSITQLFGRENTAKGMLPLYEKLGLLGHNGIDFACPMRTIIRAAHDGVVTFAGEDGSAGLGIVIRDVSGTFKTIYWHIDYNGFIVKAGVEVEAGQPIAYSGNTGMSTGPHLHFGVKPITAGESDWVWYNTEQNNGYLGAVDPMPYFNTKDTATSLWSKKSALRQAIALAQKAIELLKDFLSIRK